MPILSHQRKTQRPISSHAGIQQPKCVSPREESAFPYQAPFCFVLFCFPERGSGERDLSPHTTQALGKDMRTLGSFHRTLMRWQDMETPEARAALTVHGNGSGLPSSSFHSRAGDSAAPGMSHVDIPFQLCKPALFQLQETLPKEMGPVRARSLSHFIFLRLQTNDVTVKVRAREDQGCRQSARGIPLPSGVKPFSRVFQRDKAEPLTHSPSCASHHKQVLDGWTQKRLAGSHDPAPWLP